MSPKPVALRLCRRSVLAFVFQQLLIRYQNFYSIKGGFMFMNAPRHSAMDRGQRHEQKSCAPGIWPFRDRHWWVWGYGMGSYSTGLGTIATCDTAGALWSTDAKL